MADKIAFEFAPSDKPLVVDWPCTIRMPRDGGGFVEMELVARFAVAADKDIADAFSQYRLIATDGASRREFFAGKDVAAEDGATKHVPGVVLGFPQLKAKGSQSIVGMDAEAIAATLAVPHVLDGIAAGYLTMIGRGPDGPDAGRRTKN